MHVPTELPTRTLSAGWSCILNLSGWYTYLGGTQAHSSLLLRSLPLDGPCMGQLDLGLTNIGFMDSQHLVGELASPHLLASTHLTPCLYLTPDTSTFLPHSTLLTSTSLLTPLPTSSLLPT